MFRRGSKIAIIVFTLLMDLHSMCISLICKRMIFNMNSNSVWTLIHKLLTSIRPVVGRPVQCRQHTERLYIRRAVRSGDDSSLSQFVVGVEDGLFVVQSCTKLCINFCHWPHLYSLPPRRHSCCLTIKTDCRNFINSFALQTFINLLGLSHLYILWLRFVNCIIKEWIQYNAIPAASSAPTPNTAISYTE